MIKADPLLKCFFKLFYRERMFSVWHKVILDSSLICFKIETNIKAIESVFPNSGDS